MVDVYTVKISSQLLFHAILQFFIKRLKIKNARKNNSIFQSLITLNEISFIYLTFQVLSAIALGILVGVFYPGFAPNAEFISKSFNNMISMLIAPIIFFTILLGIAHMGDMKKVGRVGSKALLYFKIVDRFMSEARAITNVIGNGVATIVIAKSENEFDEAK